MKRRSTRNETGIDRISLEDGHVHDVWCAYTCINCGTVNYECMGQRLVQPDEAYQKFAWVCSACGFVHSREADLPETWTHWRPVLREKEGLPARRFWQTFFKIATEQPESYWKRCNVCGRILPATAFSIHAGFGPLGKQMECRACKGAINAVLNGRRTAEQLRESSVRRRIADMFVEEDNERIDVQALFERFGSRCFKTGKPLDINKSGSWHIDHILPSKYLYPLTVKNAALLSSEANSHKRDRWPSAFYSPQELVELARITGADLRLLSSPEPIYNTQINVNRGVDRYLNVRSSNADLAGRIREIRQVIRQYGLEDRLDEVHRKMLGLD